jgi:type I restriction enzyme S subunit
MIAEVVMGQSPPGDTYNTSGEGIALINGPVEFSPEPFGKTTVNQYTTAPTKLCDEADLLVCVRGSTTGRTNIAGFRACIGRGVAAIKPHVGREFVRLLLLNARDTLIAMGRGIAFPSVSRKQIEDLAVLLPPLSEQARIVKRVDELMALCDQIEAARVKRETKRERLTIACGRGFSHRRLPPFDTDLDDFRKDLRPDQSVQASPFGPYELSIREQRDVRQENRTDTTRGR